MASEQRLVKVWIEEGCIVCDMCESACPEVFSVQDETCTIRPEALEIEFVRSHSAAIRLAALECPTEVIKFEIDPAATDHPPGG